ncbi:MAG: hypothetical protein AAGA02_00005 [Bacteroidota bacterium]
MKEKAKSKEELREEAVEILYRSLLANQEITKEECYNIYDKMQKTNVADKNVKS